MRHLRRQQQDLAGADRHIGDPPVLDYAQHHLAFELMKELFGRVDMEVLAAVRTTHDHDDEFAVLIHELVAHRWSQQVAVAVDPVLEVDGTQGAHVDDIRHCPKAGGFAYGKHIAAGWRIRTPRYVEPTGLNGVGSGRTCRATPAGRTADRAGAVHECVRLWDALALAAARAGGAAAVT